MAKLRGHTVSTAPAVLLLGVHPGEVTPRPQRSCTQAQEHHCWSPTGETAGESLTDEWANCDTSSSGTFSETATWLSD